MFLIACFNNFLLFCLLIIIFIYLEHKPKQYARLSNEVKNKIATTYKMRACGIIRILTQAILKISCCKVLLFLKW